jgi:hypothetical protein
VLVDVVEGDVCMWAASRQQQLWAGVSLRCMPLLQLALAKTGCNRLPALFMQVVRVHSSSLRLALSFFAQLRLSTLRP